MDQLTQDRASCRAAHERLGALVREVTDADVRGSSLLSGWTVGHVLTHLARNAEAMIRRIDGAMRGEVVEQYVGGAAGRAAEIERGASRSAAELCADVVEWSARLDVQFESLGADDWALRVRTVGGGEHLVSDLPFRRWREVEVHLVDLSCGFEPSDWSDSFVQRVLPGLIEHLDTRADLRHLVAWLLGRASAPTLSPWG